MHSENRLIHKIGGFPGSIARVDKELRENPETAAAAMAHAVPKEITDVPLAIIRGKMGRPTTFTAEIAATVYERLIDPRRCWTIKSVALTMGVEESTFYKWMQNNPLLQFAVAAGRAVQENNFGSMLLHGFKYSSGVEYILTNLHNWTLRQRTEHAVDLNAAIAAQERAKREQGIVWDEASAQRLSVALLGESPKDEEPGMRESDAEYESGKSE